MLLVNCIIVLLIAISTVAVYYLCSNADKNNVIHSSVIYSLSFLCDTLTIKIAL